jgi:hypothetical protein
LGLSGDATGFLDQPGSVLGLVTRLAGCEAERFAG